MKSSLGVRLFLLAVLSGALCTPARVARAGECIEGNAYNMAEDEYYVTVLERGPAAVDSSHIEYCFDLPWQAGAFGHEWDGPQGRALIEQYRNDPYRERIEKALTSLWQSPWADSSYRKSLLVRLAASRGIPRLGTADVYSELVGTGRKDAYKAFGTGRFYQRLAILGDCRAPALLHKRYQELTKRPRRGYVGERLDIVYSLHYMECPEASRVARELEATETDSTLCRHLASVGKR